MTLQIHEYQIGSHIRLRVLPVLRITPLAGPTGCPIAFITVNAAAATTGQNSGGRSDGWGNSAIGAAGLRASRSDASAAGGAGVFKMRRRHCRVPDHHVHRRASLELPQRRRDVELL